MINIPSDTTAKFLTFAGIAMVTTCLVQQHLLFVRVDEAVAAQAGAAAEVASLNTLRVKAIDQANERLKEAAALFAKSAELLESGGQARSAAMQAIALRTLGEAEEDRKKSSAFKDLAIQKSVEQSRLLAVASQVSSGLKNTTILYNFGVVVGVALAAIGFARWSRSERKPHVFFTPRSK